MPELPEVETVARQLAPLIQGRRVERLEVLDAKLALERPEAVAGRTIRAVERLGKQILITLDGAEHSAGGQEALWLCVHLRMTGRLVWRAEPEPAVKPLRARLVLDRGALLFKDVRRFGTMRLVESRAELPACGLDPMCKEFTPARLVEELAAAPRQEIKPWLLRQDRVTGIGNIYAAEALFGARLSPLRKAGSLTPAEARRLYQALVKVLKMGIECGGTTFSDYQDAHGENGAFQKRLKVYGRAGEPCPHCGEPILRIVQQGRGTFFCPRCQPGH